MKKSQNEDIFYKRMILIECSRILEELKEAEKNENLDPDYRDRVYNQLVLLTTLYHRVDI